MKLEDFSKEEVDEHECPFWTFKKSIPTSLGDFSLVLEMLDETAVSPPDLKMLELAEETVNFVNTNNNLLSKIIFGAYKLALEQDPYSFEIYSIPSNLDQGSVGKLLPTRNIIISRDASVLGITYTALISVAPLWDEEHGLALELENGLIQSLNGDRFRLEGEKLIYE